MTQSAPTPKGDLGSRRYGARRSPESEPRPVLAASLAARQPGLRRVGQGTVTAGPKANRTRRRLLNAAHDLFTANGYLDTSVAEIADGAGVSLGTFYQYFQDRSDVVVALLQDHLAQAMAHTDNAWDSSQGFRGVYRVIYNFVSWYRDNAGFAKVWEEVCHVDDHAADLRRDLGRMLTEAIRAELIRAGRNGLCKKLGSRDADLAAVALAAMVDRFCYVSYVFDVPASGPPEPERASRILAELWMEGIGLKPLGSAGR